MRTIKLIIFFVALLGTTSLFSQCDIVKTVAQDIDAVFKRIDIPSNSNSAIHLSLIQVNEEYLGLFIATRDESVCLKEGAEIIITFADGAIFNLVNNQPSNCNGMAWSYLDTDIIPLLQILLKYNSHFKLRVNTSYNYVEEKFNTAQTNKFRNAIICLNL